MPQVVIDAFRLINPQTMMLGQEPRQTTSNLGHLHKPSIQVCHDVSHQSTPHLRLSLRDTEKIPAVHWFCRVSVTCLQREKVQYVCAVK